MAKIVKLAKKTKPKHDGIESDLLLATLPHPVIVVGDQNSILYVNASAEAFLSASQPMLCRTTLNEVVTFGCPLLALIEQVRFGGSTVNEYAIEIAAPRFSAPKLVDVHAGPVSERPGQILIMLQQRSMAQMIERQLTHRAAARSVSGMAAMLAHEIKNPLSGIRGSAQLLEQNANDDDRELTQLICTETDRIRNLVDRMEVFGDERPLEVGSVNVHNVLDHVRRIAETGFAQHIRFDEYYDPSLPLARGNKDKLVQVFLNLVKNASEAIGAEATNGQIQLRTAFRPGVRLSVPGSDTRFSLPLMIEVEDNGPGIPEGIKTLLFEPFVSTKVSGSGLGLALVAKIIGDHGGVIELDGLSKNTVFRVLLPVEDKEVATDSGKSSQAITQNKKRGSQR